MGDYLIPNLKADEQPQGTVTKYGMLRETFLKEHHSGVYSAFLLDGKLKAHLLEIQEQAETRMEEMTEKMARAQGVDGKLKEGNQMLWVKKMNSIRASAEEIVLNELIYTL
ncbi:MAG: TnpV protein [Clostridium sp.]|nr:TnpV protein [Lachnoclostridium sp.]MCM1253953.1 TnpV protein [Clostridium sp.]